MSKADGGSSVSVRGPWPVGSFSQQCSTRAHANEDGVIVVEDLCPPPEDTTNVSRSKLQLVAVIDGHGGDGCSKYLETGLTECITRTDGFRSGNYVQALEQGIQSAEDSWMALFPQDNSGACLAVALLTPTHFYLANVGDCRAVLSTAVSEKTEKPFETRDHKAGDPQETRRIQEAGGFVVRERVFGLLAVGRSIGDREYKSAEVGNSVVIALPEVYEVELLVPGHDLLILASDGVWDFVSSEEAISHTRRLLLEQGKGAEFAARSLGKLAVSRGSKDDVSVVIAQIGKAAEEVSGPLGGMDALWGMLGLPDLGQQAAVDKDKGTSAGKSEDVVEEEEDVGTEFDFPDDSEVEVSDVDGDKDPVGALGDSPVSVGRSKKRAQSFQKRHSEMTLDQYKVFQENQRRNQSHSYSELFCDPECPKAHRRVFSDYRSSPRRSKSGKKLVWVKKTVKKTVVRKKKKSPSNSSH